MRAIQSSSVSVKWIVPVDSMHKHGPSSLVAIPGIAWATSLIQTTVARAVAMVIATALRSVDAAIDKSNGEKAFRISPTGFNITLLIVWFYPERIPHNGMAERHQL